VVKTPQPRGELTEALLAALREPVHQLPALDVPVVAEPLADEDLNLALYLCYELHYRGVPGADPDWEWEPSLLELRRRLEEPFEAALREAIPLPAAVEPDVMDLALRAIEAADDAPSLSSYIEHVVEFVVQRSAYQLKEADPHSWVLPRLSGPPKAALVEIQADEYGGGVHERVHAQLFARAMDAIGLDSRYGAYIDHIPGYTLATVNLMSLLGLHRRCRGALIGHLALFEMTSTGPNRRYGNGLRRLGFGVDATAFFDEHVEADAVHENVAAVDLAGGLARQQPELTRDILWGATALIAMEGAFARGLLDAWGSGRSSLRTPLGSSVEAAASV